MVTVTAQRLGLVTILAISHLQVKVSAIVEGQAKISEPFLELTVQSPLPLSFPVQCSGVGQGRGSVTCVYLVGPEFYISR